MATAQPMGLAETSAAESVYGMLEAEEPGAPTSGNGQDQSAETREAGRESAMPKDERPTGESREEAAPEAPAGEEQATDAETRDGAGDESAEGEEARQPATMAELAEVLEVEPSFLYGLEIGVEEAGSDGEPRALTVGDLKDRVQELARVGTERAEIAGQRQALAAQQQEQLTEMSKRLGVADALLERLSAAWVPDSLRAENPGEWNARRTDIEQIRREIDTIAQGEAQKVQEQQAQTYAQTVEAERAKLVQAWPEWGSPEKAASLAGQLSEFAVKQYGFTPQDVQKTVDSRLYLMMRDAMAYHRGAKDANDAKVTAAKKRALKLPRIMKSGTTTSDAERRAEAKAEQMQALRQMGQSGADQRAGIGLAASIVDGMLDDM